MKKTTILISIICLLVYTLNISAQTTNKNHLDSINSNFADSTNKNYTDSTNKSHPDSTIVLFISTEHDYGTIKKGEDGSYSFVFLNTGTKPVFITNVETSCGCTTPYWPEQPIMPGFEDEINIEYDTHKVGNFQKTVTVYTSENTVVLKIKGNVVE